MAKLLHEILNCLSGQQAAKPALICGDSGSVVTYGELVRKVDSVSARLEHIGLVKGDRVGIIARKSADTVAAFLGASRAGIVFAPIDVSASPSYWSMVLDELSISVVLSDIDGVQAQLPGVRVFEIHTDAPTDSNCDGVAPREAVGARSADDDAYILATSGSTGRPKGVLLSHENALAFASWAADEVSLGPDDKVLSIAPFHFDLSVFDIYATLGRGACVVIAPAMATMFPGQLIEAIDRYKISVLYSVPTILRTLLEAGAFLNDGGQTLRTIMYAGEPFPAPSLARLMRVLPKVAFYNFFGPTETNVCLAYRFDGPIDPAREVPIGRPASCAQILHSDEAGLPVKSGEVGELFVEGPTVMKGYITAEGFKPAMRPFPTGDFATMGNDGCYYFRGRRDNQVKVRGVRIELGSVERVLSNVSGVNETIALVIERDLVGFVGGQDELDETALREACAMSLPSGAVPHRFVVMKQFPRLSNGKVDLINLKSHALHSV